MEILSRKLSEKTECLVTEIRSRSSLPVKFFTIELRPGGGDTSFGSTLTHPTDGIYKVWLRNDLPQEPFEANLLHELYHTVQAESQYPEVYNKDSAEFHSKDQSFIQGVGGRLSSVILDLDVNTRLSQNGYSHSYFDAVNLEGMIRNKDYPYTGLQDPLNFANLALAILHLSLSLEEGPLESLYTAYSAYPRIIETVKELREQIISVGVTTPLTAAACQALLIDTFGLWKYYYVLSPSVKIRTHSDFLRFCEANQIDFASGNH